MPRKSVKNRLQDDKIAMVKRLNEWEAKLDPGRSVFALTKQDPTSTPEALAYAWQMEARGALRIVVKPGFLLFANEGGGTRRDAAPDYVNTVARDLLSTFEKFKLDPDNPSSWRTMAEYLSIIFSGPQSKRGRPVEYTTERLMQIRQQRESAALKNLSDSEAAKRLAKTRAGSTRKSGAEGLRKQFRKARSLGTK
jgi:hypothetical protein